MRPMSSGSRRDRGLPMYLLAVVPFALALFWLVVVVLRLRALNDRLRANLAGCTGYPVSSSSRRPVSVYRKGSLSGITPWCRVESRRRAAEPAGGA